MLYSVQETIQLLTAGEYIIISGTPNLYRPEIEEASTHVLFREIHKIIGDDTAPMIAEGLYAGTIETVIIAPGLTKADGLWLAVKYGQESFIWVDKHLKAQLIYTLGDKADTVIRSQDFTISTVKPGEDNYTAVSTANRPIYFQIHFQF